MHLRSRLNLNLQCSNARNPLPAEYAQISEALLPAELYPDYTAIEYTLPQQTVQYPPTFLLVVDLCVGPEDIDVRPCWTLSKIEIHSESLLHSFRGAVAIKLNCMLGNCPHDVKACIGMRQTKTLSLKAKRAQVQDMVCHMDCQLSSMND